MRRSASAAKATFPSARVVPEGACDVWVARPAAFEAHRHSLDALLSPVERAQVERFRAEEDRARARASRALLRVLIGRYLGREAGSLDLDRRCPVCGGAHGKPRLNGAHRLAFSVSHCADLLVFAFDGGAPVGVDVERLDGQVDPPSRELMELVLTPGERLRVEEAPVATRAGLFLGYWTAKEAVVKQLGTGVSVPLASVAVGSPASSRRVQLDLDGRRDSTVWVRDLDLGPSHAAAIATAHEVTRLRVGEVPEGVVP